MECKDTEKNGLATKIAAGDSGAFEKLYHLYYKSLCQFAFLFLQSKEISEEVVSDVFLQMWIKRLQIKQVNNIRSYLYTAVRHKAIDYLRAKPGYPHDDISAYDLDMPSLDPSAAELIEQDDFHDLLQRAFDKLPERCRMIARLHYNDQLQYTEIAQILDVSRKTVENQIVIAIGKVKEIFDRYGWTK